MRPWILAIGIDRRLSRTFRNRQRGRHRTRRRPRTGAGRQIRAEWGSGCARRAEAPRPRGSLRPDAGLTSGCSGGETPATGAQAAPRGRAVRRGHGACPVIWAPCASAFARSMLSTCSWSHDTQRHRDATPCLSGRPRRNPRCRAHELEGPPPAPHRRAAVYHRQRKAGIPHAGGGRLRMSTLSGSASVGP